MENQPRSSSSSILFLALVPLFTLGGFIFYFINKPSEEPRMPAKDNFSEFNLPETPDAPEAPRLAMNLPQGTVQAPPKTSGPGLSGLVIERDKMFKKDPLARKEAEREAEAEFIRKYDHLIKKEQARLGAITTRYYKKHSIVRDVDKAFTNLPRYMKLKEKYDKDRNGYAFARGAVSLPEVRKLIRKFALKPEVWKVTMGMAKEALQKPPPKEVYKEMSRFMSQDETVSGFMKSFMNWMKPKASGVIGNVITEGGDLSALQAVAGDVVPGVFPGSSRKRKKHRQ